MFMKHESLYKEYGTMITYKYAVQKFESIYNMKLEDIKNIHIQQCVDSMIKDKLKIPTIKLYVGKIKVIFDSAVNHYNAIPNSPIVNIKIPENKELNSKRALTKNELNDLLSKIKNPKYYIASLIAATCGLRLGEILGLTWDDVDFKKNTINVNKQWKEFKNSMYGFGELKTKNSKRIIPVPKTTLKELEEYKNSNKVVCINNRLLKYKIPTDFSLALRTMYKQLGYNISIHELRHTYATTLIANLK